MKLPIQKVTIGVNFLTLPKTIKFVVKKIKELKRKKKSFN
jgi:hypothetical protein